MDRLSRIIVLINSLHGLKKTDVELLEYLNDLRPNYNWLIHIGLTKTDLINGAILQYHLDYIQNTLMFKLPTLTPPIFEFNKHDNKSLELFKNYLINLY